MYLSQRDDVPEGPRNIALIYEFDNPIPLTLLTIELLRDTSVRAIDAVSNDLSSVRIEIDPTDLHGLVRVNTFIETSYRPVARRFTGDAAYGLSRHLRDWREQ